MTIPRNIRKEHIVKAIDEANRQPWPSKRSARTHHLLHDGRLYPVKYIISLANKYAGGGELPSEAFISTESRVLLERLGFPIISQRPVAATPESPAETNTFSINDKTVYIRNTAKPSRRDAFQSLGPDKIGAPYNSGLIGTNRTRAYMDAYGFIFAAMSDGPMPCIGDKAVTNCLIGAGYLVYDAATHTLHPRLVYPRILAARCVMAARPVRLYRPYVRKQYQVRKLTISLLSQTAGSPAHQADNASVAQDIEKILTDKAIDATSRQTLIDARIGQANSPRRYGAMGRLLRIFRMHHAGRTARISHQTLARLLG